MPTIVPTPKPRHQNTAASQFLNDSLTPTKKDKPQITDSIPATMPRRSLMNNTPRAYSASMMTPEMNANTICKYILRKCLQTLFMVKEITTRFTAYITSKFLLSTMCNSIAD